MKSIKSPYSLAFLVGDTRFELVTPCVSMRNNDIIFIDDLEKLSVYGIPLLPLIPSFPYWWDIYGTFVGHSASFIYIERNEVYELSESNSSKEKNK